VLIAALKADEPYSGNCAEILRQVPDTFILAEPSIVYQEVCGTLARRVGLSVANRAREQLDLMIYPSLLADCDRDFCASAFPLCSRFGLYAVDALYLQAAINNESILVSLDKEDFTDRLRIEKAIVEAYHVADFPY
jgi:predicted nucleic acid-binding protein